MRWWCSTLQRDELDEGLEIELGQVQERVLDCTPRPFWFRMTDLLEEGTDQRYGARHLKPAIERYLVSPLARLLGTEQLRAGDFLLIARHPAERGPAFRKDKEEHFALCPQAGTSPQMRQQQTGTQLTELLLGVYLKTIQEVPFCQHMTSLAFVLPFSLSVEWKADESWREYRGKFVLEF